MNNETDVDKNYNPPRDTYLAIFYNQGYRAANKEKGLEKDFESLSPQNKRGDNEKRHWWLAGYRNGKG